MMCWLCIVCMLIHGRVVSDSSAQQGLGMGMSLAVSEPHAVVLLLQGDLDVWPFCAQALHSKL
jgi:hypothetical protein